MKRVPAVLVLLLLSACGTASPAAPQPGREGPDLYQTTAIVLEDRSHGPMLCLGPIASSLPPQCGNVPITNWDWDAVEGEERTSGTTWGGYHLVGRYNGQTFTVVDVGLPRKAEDGFDDDPIEAPCPHPAGGWPWPDPARASEGDLTAAQRAAQAEPDFAGLWIDYLDTPNPDAPPDTLQIVVTAAFTGDLDRHEGELRELWGGPLCMVQHEHTYGELRGIQKQLMPGERPQFGLDVLGSGIDVMDNVVEIQVVALDDEVRQALEDRYGKGTVRATAALQRAD